MVLFYDADCGLCESWVERVMKRRGEVEVRAVAYQDAEEMERYGHVDREHEGVQVWWSGEQRDCVSQNELAVAECLEVMGRGGLAAVLRVRGLRWLWALGYRVVVANRHRISGRMGQSACRVRR